MRNSPSGIPIQRLESPGWPKLRKQYEEKLAGIWVSPAEGTVCLCFSTCRPRGCRASKGKSSGSGHPVSHHCWGFTHFPQRSKLNTHEYIQENTSFVFPSILLAKLLPNLLSLHLTIDSFLSSPSYSSYWRKNKMYVQIRSMTNIPCPLWHPVS